MVIDVFYLKKSAPEAGKFVVNFKLTMGGPSEKLINLGRSDQIPGRFPFT